MSLRTKIIYPQWFAGFGVFMFILQLGFIGGWPSPVLVKLTSPESEIPTTLEEGSWIASLVNFGRFFGAVLGAISANYFGSKFSIVITLCPMAIGWLMIGLANSVPWLYVARISSGIGLGMTYSVFPIYIGEVSMPNIRGALISLATVGAPTGQVISSIASSYLNMLGSASIYFVHAILLMVLFIWLPESPHHLIKIGKRENAKKSIDWYRNGIEVEKELDSVEQFVTASRKNSFFDKLKEFKKSSIRRATIQIMIVFTFMQICGLNTILFYMETILIRAKVTNIDTSLAVVFINFTGIIADILSMSMIDRFGRKFLLIISSVGITISMIGLMSHFLLINLNIDVTNLQWLPLLWMSLFIISFCVGMYPVPNAILSETFPSNIKYIASCIASLTGALMAFISSKTYQPMVDLMGETYVFLIYAILSALIIPFAIFSVRETKGKTLQQIQDVITKK